MSVSAIPGREIESNVCCSCQSRLSIVCRCRCRALAGASHNRCQLLFPTAARSEISFQTLNRLFFVALAASFQPLLAVVEFVNLFCWPSFELDAVCVSRQILSSRSRRRLKSRAAVNIVIEPFLLQDECLGFYQIKLHVCSVLVLIPPQTEKLIAEKTTN